MSSIHIAISENGLNLQYMNDFIPKSDADRYFGELCNIPFYKPTLIIGGKEVKPKRKVYAYGDPNTSYAFSGTCIQANPWTPLMIELRDKVEKQTACTYNYVLLNCYPNGSSYIGQHKDNESTLDFPIVVLSFGAQRTIEFKRPNVPTTSIDLEHGSFFSMEKPTNELFTHGIVPDPTIQHMRISLMFRHLISHPLDVKKLKLDSSDNAEFNLDLFNISPIMNEPILQNSEDIFPFNMQISNKSQKIEWFICMIEEIDGFTPGYWNLGLDTIVKVEMEKSCNLTVDITNYKEGLGGELFPTENGIAMSCSTFNHFASDMITFNFYSVKDSFISNNELLTSFLNEEYCLLQQIYKDNQNRFHFKPCGIQLSSDQFFKLRNICSEIIDCLIDTILTRVIPISILRKVTLCVHSHISVQEAKDIFSNCFSEMLETSVHQVFHCYGCAIGELSQLEHDCLSTTLQEKFNLYKDSALLNFNVYKFVKKLTEEQCVCQFTPSFFTCLNSDFYENYLECIFLNK